MLWVQWNTSRMATLLTKHKGFLGTQSSNTMAQVKIPQDCCRLGVMPLTLQQQ